VVSNIKVSEVTVEESSASLKIALTLPFRLTPVTPSVGVEVVEVVDVFVPVLAASGALPAPHPAAKIDMTKSMKRNFEYCLKGFNCFILIEKTMGIIHMNELNYMDDMIGMNVGSIFVD